MSAADAASSVRRAGIGRRFAQAAMTYDKAAVLQRGIAESLLAQAQRVVPVPVVPQCWADIGCGTGYLTRRLLGQQPAASQLWGIDIARPMLAVARSNPSSGIHWLQADATALPLGPGSLSRLYSNLALQWLDDLGTFLCQIDQCLQPGGWAIFSTLGDGTLSELRFLQRLIGQPRPSLFMSSAMLLSVIEQSPLRLCHHRQQSYCCHYPTILGLLKGLSQLGVQGPAAPAGGLKGRQWLARWEQASNTIRTPYGIPARYDSHFFILQKPG